ncbi:MAG TPA: TlpA disulfide reductase family protein [Candidatus Nanoarchaeia archaeon]|nr:TlpA disulfide reductase family protein [Candidatus Nanoarchaeia archaeon]
MRWMMIIGIALVLAACGAQEAAQPPQGQDEGIISGAMPLPDAPDTEEMIVTNGYAGAVLAGSASPYLAFTMQDYEKAKAEGKVILLNFYASWCPICRAEEPEALAAFNELDQEKVIGFRVNYRDSETDDAEQALAKEFGIPYQHTKVILKDGKQLLKAPDSWDKERYLAEIAKAAG